MTSTDILKVENLNVWFQMREGFFKDLLAKETRYAKAVDGVSFNIKKGEIFCLVGESGCGKTTTGKGILRLVEPTSGSIIFADDPSDPVMRELLKSSAKVTLEDGRPAVDVRKLPKAEMKFARRKIQMIFQDPYESLNPKMTVFDIVAEPLIVNHLTKNEKEKEERVKKALQDAGLRPPEQFMWRYPHQVSGGQRQRVGIAGALVLEPTLLVADEPISMLDVSIRGDILKLMLELREKKRLTYLFITHDLSVAYVFSDRIGVMYLGRIVEMGPTERVIKNPKHPYTQALITVVPKPDPTAKEEKIILKGERPDPTNIPKGCRFHPRCPYVMEICKTEQPQATQIEPEHWAECFLLTPDVVKKWESEKAVRKTEEEKKTLLSSLTSPAAKK
ncbi:MAG: ABC transporter ATP-binding protein [Thermoplasmata archaeon]